MTMGVYAITNTITGEQYVGSSQDIDKRWMQHRSLLRGHRHSLAFQAAWDRDGESAFRCDVLEVVEDKEALVEAEQRHINALKPTYNSTQVVIRNAVKPARKMRDAIPLHQAAKMLGVPTSVVRRLVSRGLLEIHVNVLDKRARYVAIDEVEALKDWPPLVRIRKRYAKAA